MADTALVLPDGYVDLLTGLKSRVRDAQVRAQRMVNTQLIELYWQIGNEILLQQQTRAWGSGVVRRLGEDLRVEFPEMTGLSYRNLQYMRSFAAAWAGASIVQQAVAQLPWGHITVLLDRLDDPATRDWYAAAAVQHGWSRNVLMNQIMNRTHERVGSGPTNFTRQLPAGDSELAQQIAKDPYVFDFLDLSGEVAERDMEQALMDRIVETLRELGAGFAFIGRQVHFDVGGDDFYLDLLFFHAVQLRYVVVELKAGKFQPEYAGKLGFYVGVVDDKLRLAAHNPTIGMLICGSRNDHTVQLLAGSVQLAVSGVDLHLRHLASGRTGRSSRCRETGSSSQLDKRVAGRVIAHSPSPYIRPQADRLAGVQWRICTQHIC